MNKKLMLLATTSLGLMACTQNAAPIFQKGNQFYGRNARYENGQEIPRYSDNNRARQDERIADKYHSRKQQYAVPAAVEKVETATLPPPEPMQVSEQKSAQPQSAGNPFGSTSVSARAQPAAMLAPLPIAPANKTAAEDSSRFIWPVEGKIVSHFGTKSTGLKNDGINIEASEGQPIHAAADGDVVYAGNELKGYGNMIILRHPDGWMTAYAHTKEMQVHKGDKVAQGDKIGTVGKTGGVNTAQLHFGIREGKDSVDPEPLLPKHLAAVD